MSSLQKKRPPIEVGDQKKIDIKGDTLTITYKIGKEFMNKIEKEFMNVREFIISIFSTQTIFTILVENG